MASIWVESLGHNFEQALDLLAAAVRDCTDELWETAMWQVPALDPGHELLGPEDQPVTEPAQRRALVQRHSTPWGVAWHALECFDYDLDGESGQWAPPAPFSGHPHWRDLTRLPAAWSRSELLGYIDYCRQQVRIALAAMTEEKAAAPLPPAPIATAASRTPASSRPCWDIRPSTRRRSGSSSPPPGSRPRGNPEVRRGNGKIGQ